VRVWVDANPKQLAIVAEDGRTTVADIHDDVTSNEAEYRAVLGAVLQFPGEAIEVHSDSQLVVRQLNHEWHIKSDRLRHLASLVWKDITPGTKFIWICRGENKAGKVLG